ncbi:DUF3427 domain-containing protein [Microbacterium aerolatum]|uniref:DUF3427 domain-containing protein n=1 Tax=Microbacterium aerolatum TaxID=153731 RepID=UPI00384EC8C1
MLRELLNGDASLSEGRLRMLLDEHHCASDDATIVSLKRILTQEFFTQTQREQYGSPLVTAAGGEIQLSSSVRESLKSHVFRRHLNDAIETGLYLARHQHQWSSGLEIGNRYSRKDVCRLLNWRKNEEGTINGYKVDTYSGTCPIFVTYHKHEDVSASTAYGDEFLNQSEMHWFTRSRRTLASAEVQAIVTNRIPLHLFAKKDNAEGRDYYYLGEARASSPQQTQMPNDGAPLSVVTMTLGLDSPIESSLYDYFVSTTDVEVEYEGLTSRSRQSTP